MTNDIRRLIHRVYGIAISAVTVISGTRIALACHKIYTTGKAAGGQIYSRQAVAEAFAPIALSVYLCLALVIGGFILHWLLPPENPKRVTEKNRQLILNRLHAKTDLSQCGSELRSAVKKQQKKRRLHLLISAALLIVFSIGFLMYVCMPSRWPEDLTNVTAAVVPAVLWMFACLAIPTGYAIFTAYFCRFSMDKEIKLMQQACKEAPSSPAQNAAKTHRANWMQVIRFAIVALAAGLMLYGYFTGGIEDVIAKAAAICTECVGLG